MNWIAMILVVVSAYLLTKQNKFGTLLGAAGSVLWIMYFAPKEEWAVLILNVIFAAIYLVGWFSWETIEADKDYVCTHVNCCHKQYVEATRLRLEDTLRQMQAKQERERHEQRYRIYQELKKEFND